MRTSEWIVVAYLGYLAALAWILPVAARRRALVTAVAALDVVVVAWLAQSHRPDLRVVRNWSPALQILIGYWLSGAFFRAPMPRVEAWLVRTDRQFFDGLGVYSLVQRGPRAVLEYLELAYLSVYVLVPVGFGVAYGLDPQLDIDRYWTVVVGAELASYAMLPWIQTRPPRALQDHMAIDSRQIAVRRLNFLILARGSIQVNTIPSGHAAGAFATALAVSHVSPVSGAIFFVLALSIVAGSVIGRYHFAADSVLGLLVAFVVWAVA